MFHCYTPRSNHAYTSLVTNYIASSTPISFLWPSSSTPLIQTASMNLFYSSWIVSYYLKHLNMFLSYFLFFHQFRTLTLPILPINLLSGYPLLSYSLLKVARNCVGGKWANYVTDKKYSMRHLSGLLTGTTWKYFCINRVNREYVADLTFIFFIG